MPTPDVPAELELERQDTDDRAAIARRAIGDLRAAQTLLARGVADETRARKLRAMIARSALAVLRYSEHEPDRELARAELDALDRERFRRRTTEVLNIVRGLVPARTAAELTPALQERVIYELMRRRPEIERRGA